MGISSSTGIWEIGDNWPWPRVVMTDYYNIAFAKKADGKLALYEMVISGSNWVASEKATLGNASNINSVSVAPFFTYYVITVDDRPNNQSDKGTYYRNPLTGAVTEWLTSEVPAGTCCCAWRGQFLVGGLWSTSPPWVNIPSCSVAWSDIGSINMHPEDYITAGYAPMPWDENGNGEIWAMHSLDEIIRVYGDRGICNLIPFGSGDRKTASRFVGFGVSAVETPGIFGTYCVAGDEKVHGFVDTNYDWNLITGEKAVNLGYRRHLENLDSTKIVVSYDKYNKRFYISDGSLCYVYSKNGMYTTNQCLSSVGYYNNIICGFVKDNSDDEIRITTKPFDLGYQDQQTLESIEAGITYDTTNDEIVYGSLDVKYDYKGDFISLGDIELNPRGIFTQKTTGREFRINLKSNYESGADFALSSLKAKIKFSDKRNTRGRINVS